MTCSTIAQLDFPVKRGADFRRVFRFKDTNDQPIDLTGYAVKFKALHRGTTIDLALPITLPGDASLHLDPAATRTIPIGRLMNYALEVREPGTTPPGSGDQSVVVEGFLVGEQGEDNND